MIVGSERAAGYISGLPALRARPSAARETCERLARYARLVVARTASGSQLNREKLPYPTSTIFRCFLLGSRLLAAINACSPEIDAGVREPCFQGEIFLLRHPLKLSGRRDDPKIRRLTCKCLTRFRKYVYLIYVTVIVVWRSSVRQIDKQEAKQRRETRCNVIYDVLSC